MHALPECMGGCPCGSSSQLGTRSSPWKTQRLATPRKGHQRNPANKASMAAPLATNEMPPQTPPPQALQSVKKPRFHQPRSTHERANLARAAVSPVNLQLPALVTACWPKFAQANPPHQNAPMKMLFLQDSHFTLSRPGCCTLKWLCYHLAA